MNMTFANPHQVPRSWDQIQEPHAEIPNWSENINLAVHSGRDEVGIYSHLSRMPDPGLWEGVLTIFLPEGELLVSRSFGRTASPDQASSGQLSWTVGEPLERWTERFDGMARRIIRTDATTGFVTDGPTELLHMDLHIEAAGPVWSLEHALKGPSSPPPDDPGSELSFGSLHLQQAVRVRGRVRTARGSYDIDNLAVRDHSAGARDYAGLRGDHWATCGFPDGRVLSVLHIWQTRGAPSIATGFLTGDDELVPVRNVKVNELRTAAGDPQELRMEFETPSGPTRVDIALQHSMAFTLHEPIGMPLGTCGSGLITVQGPARYRWNGVEALGWLERVNRLDPAGER